jgi:spermidine/putrescine transport system permease protein
MTRRAIRTAPAALTVAALGYALLHLPVLVLAVFSFNASRFSVSWTGATLDWYRELLARGDVARALRLSLTVGLVSTAAATTLGTLLALALERHRFRGRRALEAATILPIVTPEIVMGISLLLMFATLRIPLGMTTVTIAHIAFNVSFVVVVVRARLAGLDPALEEAALTLGATEWRTLRRVTLPLAAPGIAAAALLAFTMSLDDFVVTFFVAGPGTTTLPVLVYGMARRTVEPTINAVSTLLVAATTMLVLLYDRFATDRRTDGQTD